MPCPLGHQDAPGDLSLRAWVYTTHWLLVTPWSSPVPSAMVTLQHSSYPHFCAQAHSRGTCWVRAEGVWAGPRAPETGEGEATNMSHKGSGRLELVWLKFPIPQHMVFCSIRLHFLEHIVEDQINNNCKIATTEYWTPKVISLRVGPCATALATGPWSSPCS